MAKLARTNGSVIESSFSKSGVFRVEFGDKDEIGFKYPFLKKRIRLKLATSEMTPLETRVRAFGFAATNGEINKANDTVSAVRANDRKSSSFPGLVSA